MMLETESTHVPVKMYKRSKFAALSVSGRWSGAVACEIENGAARNTNTKHTDKC